MTARTIGEIVEAMAERVEQQDSDGACDVLDEQFLAEWPDLPRKCARDVRGLVVAAYNAGAAKAIAIKAMAESELASERAKSAGLQKRCEQLKADAFDGFDRLARERDAALAELRKWKPLTPADATPNMPGGGEVV